MLNYLTPHGKWHIHSHLRRQPADDDALARLLSVLDERQGRRRDRRGRQRLGRGLQRQRRGGHAGRRQRAHSARHLHSCTTRRSAPIGVPKSPLRGNKRAGGHNSLTRIRLKPNLMVGGYGQFTYHFNYWGPTGGNRDTYILVRKLEGEPQW